MVPNHHLLKTRVGRVTEHKDVMPVSVFTVNKELSSPKTLNTLYGMAR
jgi:hypothetical protein